MLSLFMLNCTMLESSKLFFVQFWISINFKTVNRIWWNRQGNWTTDYAINLWNFELLASCMGVNLNNECTWDSNNIRCSNWSLFLRQFTAAKLKNREFGATFKQSEDDPKTIRRRSKDNPRTIRGRSEDDPRTIEDDPRTIPKTIRGRSEDDPKTIQRRSEDDPKTIRRRSEDDSKTI